MIIDRFDEFKSLHYIFTVQSFRCVALENNIKVGAKLNESQILLIASPGIFFIGKNWIRNYKVKSVISYASIRQIHVSETNVEITTPHNVKVQFSHDNKSTMIDLAVKIHYIRDLLFGNRKKTYSLIVDQTVQAIFHRSLTKFKDQDYFPNSKIVDIFYSYLLKNYSYSISGDLNAHYFYLTKLSNTLVIDKTLLSMQFFTLILASLSINDSINEIRISETDFSEFIQDILISLIRKSTSVFRLIFYKVCFNSSFSKLELFLKKNAIFCGSEWIFNECNMENNYICDLLRCFENYKAQIRILVFNNCSFSENTCHKIFYDDFFFASCIASLEVLWISNVLFPNIMPFLNLLVSVDNIMKQRKLRTLSIMNCNIDISDILSSKSLYESGVININFSGNIFNKKLNEDAFINSPNYFNIILNNTNFLQCDESFSSLITALSLHKGQILKLNCANANVSKKGWEMFHNIESSIVLKTLHSLIWDGNSISLSNIKGFVSFLSNQPFLRELSISDCIFSNESITILHELARYIKVCKLTSFKIKSTLENTKLNSDVLSELLITLLKKSLLRALDITGQNIPEKQLVEIVQNFPNVLEEFHFKGNKISSASTIISIIDFLRQKNLKVISWDDKDFGALFQNIQWGRKTDILTKYDYIKNNCQLYNSPYDVSDLSTELVLKDLQKYQAASEFFSNNNESTDLKKISSQGLIDSGTVEGIFDVYSENTVQLLNECGIRNIHDPMKAVIQTFNEDLQQIMSA